MSILCVENLAVSFYTYYGVARAVNGVSFEVDADETLGVVGESGSGKSVTAAAVMGLIEPPGAITSGKVTLNGRDLLSATKEEWNRVRGREMTMCFQNPSRALNPVLRVGHQIMRVYLRHVPSATRAEARAHAIHLLREVNIADADKVMGRYPHQLSGGMCQRVMIVMALMCDPSLLILDEPTTGLDVTVQKQLMHLLLQLREKAHASQWLITHDLGVVANLCDRVVVMYGGKIMEVAPIGRLFGDAAHPYTRALLVSIPQVNQKNRLKPIPGVVPGALSIPPGCPFNPRCSERMDICTVAPPGYVEVEPGHRVACYLYGNAEGEGGPT
jgi:oligopeptide/dipeptide ABC transporter ATP-binding protein